VPDIERAILRKYNDVDVGFNDGRRISNIQRRKCFSIIGEIAEYVEGYRTVQTIEDTKEMLKMGFVFHRLQAMERKMFSLSDVSMSTASEFIDFLIQFCVKNDIPMRISPLEYCEDIAKYIYACLVNKRCCICGKPADLHHVDTIGMGNDRDNVVHIGRDALPLCREHHTELHKKGNKYFIETYHLQPVKIDKTIAKIYKLNTKEDNNVH
jgi:hypothetical protein